MKYSNNIIYFNHIIVIESLKKNEDKTGTWLYNDIIKRRVKYSRPLLTAELFNEIITKQDLIKVLNSTLQLISQKKILPYLHIEIHGNRDGLHLENGEVLRWKELHDILLEMNVLMNNNLFISLSSCYGALISKTIDIKKKSPFRGYIGTANKISSGDLHQLYDSFFDHLLLHADFDSAFKSANQNITIQSSLELFSAEHFFDLIIKELVRIHRTKRVHFILSHI